MSRISVIIPAFNEAEGIVQVIDHLKISSAGDSIAEIIVVDGSSTDNTVELADREGAVILQSSMRRRSSQMNLGARHAGGDVLYFLHADSYPPKGFDEDIIAAIASGAEAGCFRMKWDSRHPLLQFFGWFTRFSNTLCCGGDQSLFISKKLFHEIEGYREWPVMEDIDLIRRIKRKTRFKVIKRHVVTSARKYRENGYFRLQFRFAMIHFQYWLGASPDYLYRYYKRHIV